MSLDFVAIDFETANSFRASACSVGIVKVENGEITETFHSYIQPPNRYQEFNARNIGVHGITKDMVLGQPDFMEVWNMIEIISDGLPFIAHNAAFDMSVIDKSFEHFGNLVPPYEYLCTLQLARKLYPNLASHTLATLAEFTGIGYDSEQHHDALYDSTLASQLFKVIAQKTETDNFYEVGKSLGLKVSSF